MFKRIKKQQNKVEQSKLDSNQIANNQTDTSNLTKKLSKTMELVAIFKGIPIIRISNIDGYRVTKDFKGHELTIISKPQIMYMTSSFIVYNKLNTICHEIRYVGDKTKKLTIRIRLSYNHYMEFYLGNNEYQSLYVFRNRDLTLSTYREAYDIQPIETKKSYIRKTNIEIIHSDLFD